MKKQLAFQLISCAFCIIIVLANLISAKLVPIPFLAGLCVPAGLLVYPLSFFLSDLTTEIYGEKQAKEMLFIAFSMNVLAYLLIWLALKLPAHDDCSRHAFHETFGLSGKRIFSSLTAFSLSQFLAIRFYSFIKTKTESLWLRNNGSTILAQICDTFLIDFIYLYGFLNFSLVSIFPIFFLSIVYKVFFSLGCTPLFYLVVSRFRKKFVSTK